MSACRRLFCLSDSNRSALCVSCTPGTASPREVIIDISLSLVPSTLVRKVKKLVESKFHAVDRLVGLLYGSISQGWKVCRISTSASSSTRITGKVCPLLRPDSCWLHCVFSYIWKYLLSQSFGHRRTRGIRLLPSVHGLVHGKGVPCTIKRVPRGLGSI